MRLIYLPCESYRERWTEFVSTQGGMVEHLLEKYEVPYLTIRPWNEVQEIKTGVVLDTVQRCRWGFAQMEALVDMIFKGEIHPNDGDVLYIEDFWHPGMEMLPYACSVKYDNLHRIPTYAFCHAQSVDPNDFTYPMAWWMRGFEKAWGEWLSGVFVADPILRDWLSTAKIAPYLKVSAVGTIFSSSVLKKFAGVGEDYSHLYRLPARRRTVVFSSRWDKEKDPGFFCQVAEKLLEMDIDVRFMVCTGARELRSNDPQLLRLANHMEREYGLDRFLVASGLTKKKYYEVLRESAVQFNCADQDFVSYTLLEACTFGCAPLYPRYLTFPNALSNRDAHLYKKYDVGDAVAKLLPLLEYTKEQRDFSWVTDKYELSFARLLTSMGFTIPATVYEDAWRDTPHSFSA